MVARQRRPSATTRVCAAHAHAEAGRAARETRARPSSSHVDVQSNREHAARGTSARHPGSAGYKGTPMLSPPLAALTPAILFFLPLLPLLPLLLSPAHPLASYRETPDTFRVWYGGDQHLPRRAILPAMHTLPLRPATSFCA